MRPEYLILDLQLLGYWHAGTGRGQGGFVDALCNRDRLGLPFLPGRTVKGLLRDAVGLWAGAHLGEPAWRLVVELFGGPGFDDAPVGRDGERRARRVTEEGALAVTSARLLAAELAYFEQLPDDRLRALRAGLFARLSQTAIDSDRGAAKRGSLRTVEVAVPVMLEARVEPVRDAALPDDLTWQDVVRRAAPLLRAVGMGRSRGLGRCVCSVREASHA